MRLDQICCIISHFKMPLALHIVNDVVKHHFIHLFCHSSIHPFVRSFIHPVMVCLLRRGGERVEYRCGVTENNIYQCCKFLFFILRFLDLGTTLIMSLSQQLKPVSFSTTERVGLGLFFFFFFFLKFYLEYWKFSMLFTLP